MACIELRRSCLRFVSSGGAGFIGSGFCGGVSSGSTPSVSDGDSSDVSESVAFVSSVAGLRLLIAILVGRRFLLCFAGPATSAKRCLFPTSLVYLLLLAMWEPFPWA